MNKKINRIIIGIFLFLGALYIGGSLSQYAVGDRSKEFLLLITGSIIITNLVAIIEYKRNKLSKTIPWIYSIIYYILNNIINNQNCSNICNCICLYNIYNFM